jgi:hypothetical protein
LHRTHQQRQIPRPLVSTICTISYHPNLKGIQCFSCQIDFANASFRPVFQFSTDTYGRTSYSRCIASCKMYATTWCEGDSKTKSIERETVDWERIQFKWILDACRYRPDNTFPERLAQNILGVLQGDSKALMKIEQFATVNRFVVDLCVNLRIRSHIFLNL